MSRSTAILVPYCAIFLVATVFAIFALWGQSRVPDPSVIGEHGNGATTGIYLEKQDHTYSIRYFVRAGRGDDKFEICYFDMDRETGGLREFKLRLRNGEELVQFFEDYERISVN